MATRRHSTRLHIRKAETAEEVASCQELIASVYLDQYGVTFAADADPDSKVEPIPDHYVLGLVDDTIVAAAGLYTSTTYVERFGGLTEADIAEAARDAGHPDAIHRPRVEYTKLVVRPGWEGRSIGRHFLAATHSRAFLCSESGETPLVIACAKVSVFRHFYNSVGIRTRTVKAFPWYKSHERYRSEDDPMESRIVIPEVDIDPRWYEFPVPGTVEIDIQEERMKDEVAVGTFGAIPLARPPRTYVDVRVSAPEMEVHWRRCSLTADFLAGFIDIAMGDGDTQRLELSMIIDELLENAVKFSADAQDPVTVRVRDYGDSIQLETSNTCKPEHAADLERSLRRVLEGDIERLFLDVIEETALRDTSASGLGFITLRMNHGARLGARIERDPNGDLCRVTIEVLLERHQEALAS